MNATTRNASRAAAALVIRRAVAPLLLHGPVDPGLWRAASEADADAWRLFLRVERCALPLQRGLAAQPALAPHDAPFRAILDRAARREATRVLAVRALIRTVADVAAANDLTLVVLKGGAVAPGTDSVDLVDLDLLARDADGDSLIHALQQLGWIATWETSEQVTQSLLAGDTRIELHHVRGVEPRDMQDHIWERSAALETSPPLRQMGPFDHLRYVVHHAAIRHPNRRIRLRELVLIAHAAGRCSEAEVASAFAGADYATRICRSTLDAALLRSGAEAQAEHEEFALTSYVINSRKPTRFMPKELREFVDMWSVSMLQTPWERRQMWAAVHMTTPGHSSRPYIRAIEERYPALGRAWRVTARVAYRAATWIIARPIAGQTRRTVRRALDAPMLRKL